MICACACMCLIASVHIAWYQFTHSNPIVTTTTITMKRHFFFQIYVCVWNISTEVKTHFHIKQKQFRSSNRSVLDSNTKRYNSTKKNLSDSYFFFFCYFLIGFAMRFVIACAVVVSLSFSRSFPVSAFKMPLFAVICLLLFVGWFILFFFVFKLRFYGEEREKKNWISSFL